MSDNDMITTGHVPVEQVLNGASEADFKKVVVIGWTKDGEFYAASSEDSDDSREMVGVFLNKLENGF